MLYQHRVTRRIADLVIECAAVYANQGVTADGTKWVTTPKAYYNEGFRRALRTSSVEQLINVFKLTNRSYECADVIAEDLLNQGRYEDQETFLANAMYAHPDQLSFSL